MSSSSSHEHVADIAADGGAPTGHNAHSHDGHSHGVSADADRRWLGIALALIVVFMIGEVIVGVVAHSLALISDAGHMLTDAASIVLALAAIRVAAKPAIGRYTYGFKRFEILSAQANGITLVLLAAWFVYEGIRRLITPPDVAGPLVLFTPLVGIVVNIAATWSISRANRTSLNVEGAFQHILNDLYAFIGTAVAGAVVWMSGFARADAIAALVVAALMLKAGWSLIRESGRIFLEAAPAHLDPDVIGRDLAAVEGVVEIHDLHVWQISSGQPSASAHVIAADHAECHRVRARLARTLHDRYGIEHTTLQVDHRGQILDTEDEHCHDSHGPTHRSY